jgi:amidase
VLASWLSVVSDCHCQRQIWDAGSYQDYMSVTSLTGEPLIADMVPEKEHEVMTEKPGISAYELWQLHKTKKQLREEYLALWNETVKRTGTGRPMDALICPIGPLAAPPHGVNP